MILSLLASIAASAFIVGSPLPQWQEGCLDIHAINSGRGECTFFILPDGTTMLVDAGEWIKYKSKKYDWTPARPSADVRPCEVYARYIRHFMPRRAKGALDYALITHYHLDHFGTVEDWMQPDPERGYVLTGIAALQREIPIRTLIDRSYPEYESVWLPSSSKSDFYPKFVRYVTARDGIHAESFRVGDSKQLRLRHRPCRYRNFKIMNYAASGIVWNGKEAVNAYEGEVLRENGASCCFLLSYGDFDYYTGGDAGGNTRVALPVAQAIGRPIEAMKADHHLSYHTMKKETMDIYQPMVVVTQSFTEREIQPDIETLTRLFSEQSYHCRYYFSNIGPVQRSAHADLYDQAAGINGHVVIRVMPGGHEFYVIMLDDTNFEYKIKSVDGPFKCK
ncbi:MAG: MBL fold metallo-hydrolase [Bacteroidales bacterium]|nr:MBL fold metallo-hydrolase [Bacteroidales bacterium]